MVLCGSATTTPTTKILILRIDSNTNAITARIDLGDQLGSGAILYTDSAVWVASWNRDTDHDAISRIDPQTNAVVATITYSTNLQFSLAISNGSVWVLGADGMLLGVDPQSSTIVEKVKVVSNPAGLLAIGSTLWVGDNAGSTVMKLDLTR